MSNLVIVAIPREDDYVWKLSSEKVPHMTLLFLGDVADQPVLKIYEFLQHAVDVMQIHPFGAEVDFRGTLGPDEADVLFFRKSWGLKQVTEFRDALLKDTNIRKGYDSVAQYPLWTPHLTMGYPESPAKEDTRDYPGIHWVEFDKIALWTGDFEGPEIQLEYQDDLMEVAMSAEAGEAFIRHYGVKGMKWGVRKNRPAPSAKPVSTTPKVRTRGRTTVKTKGGQSHPPTEDAIRAAIAKQKLKKSGHAALTNQELQDLMNRLNLEVNVTQLIKKQPDTPAKALVKGVLKDPKGAQRKVEDTVAVGKVAVKGVKKVHKLSRGKVR